MIFRELSNATFRFSLRRPGAEIMGGAFKRPPPPQQAVGNPEAQQGRGLTGEGGPIRPPLRSREPLVRFRWGKRHSISLIVNYKIRFRKSKKSENLGSWGPKITYAVFFTKCLKLL